MLRETLLAARDLGRLHEIASVLIRWGFGDVVRRIGLSGVLERAGRVLHWKDAESLAELEPPERVCRVLEELGPTFIKLGQVLANRVDLFEAPWISAFEKLQDDVPALPFEKLEAQLEEDFEEGLERVFLKVDRQPLAAASIAQVHRATLHDGSEVIIKIRRPDIEQRIEKDLSLLARIAEIAEANIEELKRYRPIEIVRQFSASLKRELDLAGESRYAEKIAHNLQSLDYIVIPKVYWEYTRERVNVQAYIEGVRGRDLEGIKAQGNDLSLLASRGAQAVLHMVLVDGLFHADPHLGNIISLSENRIAFIDFGMVGRLSDARREEITDLLFALVKRNTQGVLDVLVNWSNDANINLQILAQEVDDFLDHYHGISLKQLDFTSLLTDLMRIIRDHEIILPPDLAMLFKTFLTLDGVGRRLDPDFNIVDEATPSLTRLIHQRYLPTEVIKRTIENSAQMITDVSALPGEARELVKAFRRGGLKIHVDMSRLDHFGHQMDRAASRLTIGIVIAALIIGTAIVTATQPERTILGLPMWGIVGFAVAVFGGIWLLISIWRGARD